MDALSQKSGSSLAALVTRERLLFGEMRRFNLHICVEGVAAQMSQLKLQPTLVEQVKEAQKLFLGKLYDKAKSERFPRFTLGEDDLVRF